jgi:hypothetical protein
MSPSSVQLGSTRAPRISEERRSDWPLYVVPCCRFTSEHGSEHGSESYFLTWWLSSLLLTPVQGCETLPPTDVDPRVKHHYLYISPPQFHWDWHLVKKLSVMISRLKQSRRDIGFSSRIPRTLWLNVEREGKNKLLSPRNWETIQFVYFVSDRSEVRCQT